MEGLGRLAHEDVDRLRSGEEVVLLEERLADREDARVRDQVLEDLVETDEGIDALRAVALEVVAAEELGREVGAEDRPHRVEHGRWEKPGDDDEAMLLDRGKVARGGVEHGKRDHRAARGVKPPALAREAASG